MGSSIMPEPYDKKTLLLFHLLQRHPNAMPVQGHKSLKECVKNVTIHGVRQWVVWYNTPDGSTHILTEEDINGDKNR